MPRHRVGPTLQDQSLAADLPVWGTKAGLSKRLNDYMKCQESNIQKQPDSFCEGVLVTQAKLTSNKETTNDAKGALQEELNRRALEIENTRGEGSVGNRRGLNLIAMKNKLEIQTAEMELRKAEITSLQHNVDRLNNYVDQLNDYVGTLRLSLKGYKNVRQSFITTYKRDKLHMEMTPADLKIIHEGNPSAHSGDVTRDALLYEGFEARHDISIFIKLYGIDPFIVQNIKHKETLTILNHHAEVQANTEKTGTEEFYECFKVFVTEFQASDRADNYLSCQPPTAVTQAYWKFLKCRKYQDN